jgi:hypothetical protein
MWRHFKESVEVTNSCLNTYINFGQEREVAVNLS